MKCGVVRTKAVGVVVPVHNEEELLGPALGAIECAFSEVMHRGIEGRTAIVLDGCSDNSATIARHWARSLARLKVPHQSVVVLPTPISRRRRGPPIGCRRPVAEVAEAQSAATYGWPRRMPTRGSRPGGWPRRWPHTSSVRTCGRGG